MRPETIADAARCKKHSVSMSSEPLLMLGIDTARNPVNVTLLSSSDAGLCSSSSLLLLLLPPDSWPWFALLIVALFPLMATWNTCIRRIMNGAAIRSNALSFISEYIMKKMTMETEKTVSTSKISVGLLVML